MRIIGVIIALVAGIWVFSDAQKRGYTTLSAALWGIGTFALLIVFLPLYLIFRNRKTAENKPMNEERLEQGHDQKSQAEGRIEQGENMQNSSEWMQGEQKQQTSVPETHMEADAQPKLMNEENFTGDKSKE